MCGTTCICTKYIYTVSTLWFVNWDVKRTIKLLSMNCKPLKWIKMKQCLSEWKGNTCNFVDTDMAALRPYNNPEKMGISKFLIIVQHGRGFTFQWSLNLSYSLLKRTDALLVLLDQGCKLTLLGLVFLLINRLLTV